jgi:hypothetical protein
MYDVFKGKRREPRVRLNTAVTVTGLHANGEAFSYDTITVDVSPGGAAVRIAGSIACGTIVDFATRGYAFRTRAVVRSVEIDQVTGTSVVGVEYLDEARNPIVIWSPPSSRRPASS